MDVSKMDTILLVKVNSIIDAYWHSLSFFSFQGLREYLNRINYPMDIFTFEKTIKIRLVKIRFYFLKLKLLNFTFERCRG